MEFLSFLVTLVVLRVFSQFTTTLAVVDTLRPPEIMRDSNNTALLVSKEGMFGLGFFTPTANSSKNRYLGIWYNNITGNQTVVWVANRCEPIKDSSGSLSINDKGDLVLFSGQSNNRVLVWSSNSSKQAKEPLVQLLDNGNLVLRDEKDANTTKYLWESFDYPTDTMLPGIKLGWDLRRGLNRRLSSWKSSDDPCHGNYTYGIELGEPNNTFPQLIIRNGSSILYREGPWRGVSFSGPANFVKVAWQMSDYIFVENDDEIYFTYNTQIKSLISRIFLSQAIDYMKWTEAQEIWESYYKIPLDQCDNYGTCKANAKCIMVDNKPVCQCLEGYEPKKRKNLFEGCVRNSVVNCQDPEKDVFHLTSELKVPETKYAWANKSMNLGECNAKCLSNCSCTAYGYNSNLDGNNSDLGIGTECVLLFGDLFDTRNNKDIYGREQNVYLRIPFSTSDLKGTNNVSKVKIAVIIVAVIVFIGLVLIGYYICRRRYINAPNIFYERNESQNDEMELPLFYINTIRTATNNFSDDNKLGQGGFGPVYKGTLEGGTEIAVKSLSMNSGQGVNEFKNEIELIAKLQHRNLVKIFGYCTHREMKLLIYEYMSNKSLDYFIFDESRSILLEWPKRFQIICGIAKGILYLHHDSRLRIVHRDLKASNVLLDDDMNPKISDFGLARTFGGDQIEGNTHRVVGTYGYMAPEYASDGIFSIKSDVFSFGILILEIVSGRKSRSLYEENSPLNLVGYAWTLMKEGSEIKLIEKCLLKDPNDNMEEALRCIHIGLLCVQQMPTDRPDMSSVVLMLSGEKALPHPKPPAYFNSTYSSDADYSSSNRPQSCNVSMTAIEGR
ncbi:G-type lectin S-receptor-like serine/threonine-protein kinase At4g27290 [Cannabis sativa]|uniref:G-type lectin S-receptor-like serine/threonine-protein kinase At4g27290 n=1 Tax=Cannabis sativa TaxID=3483 RepID=UPI0029CA54DC|nr:G-type lectin S-receptor-like serine/threonine-protein kinase At4g27290 [Cannabis sativa]XP_060965751.1 G-type lectin S-receptor-like serine/threonine-protein kinase At4g27290 [Cannabis sativa]